MLRQLWPDAGVALQGEREATASNSSPGPKKKRREHQGSGIIDAANNNIVCVLAGGATSLEVGAQRGGHPLASWACAEAQKNSVTSKKHNSGNHRVAVWSLLLPAHGVLNRGGEIVSSETAVRDVVACLTQLLLRTAGSPEEGQSSHVKLVLFGYSLGGILLLRAAADLLGLFGEDTLEIVGGLMGTGVFPSDEQRAYQQAYFSPRSYEDMGYIDFMRKYHGGEKRVSLCGEDGALRSGEIWEACLASVQSWLRFPGSAIFPSDDMLRLVCQRCARLKFFVAEHDEAWPEESIFPPIRRVAGEDRARTQVVKLVSPVLDSHWSYFSETGWPEMREALEAETFFGSGPNAKL
jgi:Alpha/beta hydrolase family